MFCVLCVCVRCGGCYLLRASRCVCLLCSDCKLMTVVIHVVVPCGVLCLVSWLVLVVSCLSVCRCLLLVVRYVFGALLFVSVSLLLVDCCLVFGVVVCRLWFGHYVCCCLLVIGLRFVDCCVLFDCRGLWCWLCVV